ncbi:uncharacterized protein LOC115724883 [Cannabis sativa]|uniref:uncharacterized protein LOC115724883 n=1 Tax=Cannabis sativa TaxID=3483 RepID=UPI0011E022AE|nr:uncharacterized protein LOC115724883 [Cannabis sativa]
MCCGSRVCMFCTCVILVVVLIGLLFGFGVFKNGFHKIKDTVDYSSSAGATANGRPFFPYYAPPPF